MHSPKDDIKGYSNRCFGKVYMKRDPSNLLVSQKTNPNYSSPDDPSVDDLENNISDDSETSRREVFTNEDHGTPYPIESKGRCTKNHSSNPSMRKYNKEVNWWPHHPQ